MIPAEHGAWGELLFPLVAALGVGRPGWLSLLASTMAVLGFLSTEAIRVLVGMRGRRALRDQRTIALRSLALFGGGAGLALLVLAFSGGVSLLPAFAVPASLGLVVGLMALAGGLKTTAGESLAGCALAACAMPVARAGDVGIPAAVALWIAWTAAFASATLAVRGLIASQKSRGGRAERWAAMALAGGTLIVVVGLALRGTTPVLVAAGFIPTAAVVFMVATGQVSVRRLRTIGWCMVASSAFWCVAIIVSARWSR